MPKRFTDTDKWKKPFIRGLEGPYKLLWMYILDDCDHAGIWQVDFEVARIRTGEQNLDFAAALNFFGERIHVISKFKWFIPDFISFQYGELSEKNRLHISVLNILSKYELGPSKPLPRGQGQGTRQGIGQGQEKGPEETTISDLEYWGKMIVNGEDQYWEQMKGRRITIDELDNFISVATRCAWEIPDQQSFRVTLKGFKSNDNARQSNKGTLGEFKSFGAVDYSAKL